MKNLHLNRENGMVFDPESGKRFKVNETGALILKGLQQGGSSLSLIGTLTTEFGLSQNQAERVYHRFARQCRLAGIQLPILKADVDAVSDTISAA